MKRLMPCGLIYVLCLTLCSCGPSVDRKWQEQYDLGVRYLSEGNYEEAIIAFTVAIEIDPKQVPAYVERGDAYISFGETEQNLEAAQSDYKTAIELDRTMVRAYLALSDVYVRQGENEKALELLQKGLEAIGGNQAIQDKLFELEKLHNHNKIDIFDELIACFSSDDLDKVKDIIRSNEFWTTCDEKGTIMESRFSKHGIYYINPSTNIGIFAVVDPNGYEGRHAAECYFGKWVENQLEGEGIVCIYNGPVKEADNSFPWMNYEDWTFTHTNFKAGLANGYCERVRKGHTGTGDGAVVAYTQKVSGNTSTGLWNGIISDISTYEDGDIVTRTGFVANGLCDEEDTFSRPDNSYRVHADEYSATDPIRGVIFTIFTNIDTNYSNNLAVRVLSQDSCPNLWNKV